jgi:hypothetical protein
MCAPDIYIGGQMRDAHSLRRVSFFQARRALFLDERRAFNEARCPFVSDGKHVGT